MRPIFEGNGRPYRSDTPESVTGGPGRPSRVTRKVCAVRGFQRLQPLLGARGGDARHGRLRRTANVVHAIRYALAGVHDPDG